MRAKLEKIIIAFEELEKQQAELGAERSAQILSLIHI